MSAARSRRGAGTLRRLARCGWMTPAIVWAHPALADPIGPLTGPVWSMWDRSWIVIGGCLLVLALYVRGYLLRRARSERVHPGRATSYVIAILLTYLVLQSPMDALSDHIFWIHCVQHLALYHWIPMLLALSAPIPELVQGLPHWARRYGLRPILRNRGVRLTWSFIQHPVVAPILFVGLLYFWLYPPIFDYTTLNETVHDWMHFSMLFDGVLFFWLMLNRRPGRVSYGKRLIILWAIMLPQILLGAYITFTRQVLYPLYAITDQGWVSSYIVDQALGGLVTWIPSSMMSVVAGLIVFRWWVKHSPQNAAVIREARRGAARPPAGAPVVGVSSRTSA